MKSSLALGRCPRTNRLHYDGDPNPDANFKFFGEIFWMDWPDSRSIRFLVAIQIAVRIQDFFKNSLFTVAISIDSAE